MTTTTLVGVIMSSGEVVAEVVAAFAKEEMTHSAQGVLIIGADSVLFKSYLVCLP